MAQFYFDIETTGFDPKKDEIITAQIQELDQEGNAKDVLQIYSSWNFSEKEIVVIMHEKLTKLGNWGFVPVGTNLIFDLTFLWEKFKKYNLEAPSLSQWLFDHPLIDIKYTLVIANNLNFKGSGLDNMTKKKTDGRNVPIWYSEKKYNLIEDYIRQETESFLEFFKKLCLELPQLVMK